MVKFRTFPLLLILVIAALVSAACSSGTESVNMEAKPEGTVEAVPGLTLQKYPSLKGDVTLAHSPGVLFATFVIMEEAKILERVAPNMKVKWRTINETSQQRDAMLAGELDFSSCSSWPFMQGWALGVPARIVAITNVWDGELFVKPGSGTSIEDFVGTGKKISPGPGTTQELVTAAYLDQQGEDPTALRNNWTLVPHADAITAVESDQLDGEFATGEFVVEARENGLESIFKLSDANDGQPFASACAAVSDAYLKTNPAVVQVYAKALREVSDWIATHRKQAAAILAKNADGKADPALFEKALADTHITDFSRDEGFMEKTGQVLKNLEITDKAPDSPDDVYAFPDATGEDW